jgi:hypothetical protein
MPKQCPPGVLCLSTELLLAGAGILIIVILGILFFKTFRPMVIQMPFQPPRTERIVTTPLSPNIIDARFARSPEPLRDWMAPPEFPPRGGIAAIPINIPTQGLPESFQAIGNISVGDGKVLPLYGRRTYLGSSDRWNYYTRTDTYNPVPLPLRHKGRDCMGDIGCPEVYSGDNLEVEGTGQRGRVRIFRMDGPRYVPGLI